MRLSKNSRREEEQKIESIEKEGIRRSKKKIMETRRTRIKMVMEELEEEPKDNIKLINSKLSKTHHRILSKPKVPLRPTIVNNSSKIMQLNLRRRLLTHWLFVKRII
jgi:tRNA U34 5-carboxymethylaminomethyl modifying GTPase MnmE/TrmE